MIVIYKNKQLTDNMNMKVYFAGSIRGGRVDAALYQKMINYILNSATLL